MLEVLLLFDEDGKISSPMQSNMTQGRIAAEHGRFTRIRQVAPMRTRIQYMVPWTTRLNIPNSISIGTAVFAQHTAESPYALQWAACFPSKLPLRVGI